MSESIISLIKENASLVGNNLRQFFQILATPREFISSIRYSSNEQLIPASIFAALMSLLSLVLHVPIYRLLNIQVENTSYLVVDTVLTYAFFFIHGSGFHLAARIFRGSGNYTSSIVSYLYLTAYFPVIGVLSIPASMIAARLIIDSGNTTSLAFLLSIGTSILRSPPTLISIVFLYVAYIWYLISLVKVFRVIHSVGLIRGMSIVLVGVSLRIWFAVWVEAPVVQIFWQAYRASH